MTKVVEPSNDPGFHPAIEAPVDPGAAPASDPSSDGRTYCAVHPNVETTLRCNKCGRYMCSRCAVRTPVGYRCKQCVHQQQDVYFTANQLDYVIAGAVSFGLGIPAAFLARLGFLLVIILALPAGGLIAEAVIRLTGKRRGRYTWMIVVGGIVLSGLVITLPELLPILGAAASGDLGQGVSSVGLLFYVLPPVLYLVMCAGAAAARLRYGK